MNIWEVKKINNIDGVHHLSSKGVLIKFIIYQQKKGISRKYIKLFKIIELYKNR